MMTLAVQLAARRAPGFERLLAAICAGTAGAVLAIEASRLARKGRDWHTLLEFWWSGGRHVSAERRQRLTERIRAENPARSDEEIEERLEQFGA